MAEFCEFPWTMRRITNINLKVNHESVDQKLALQQLKDLIGASIDFALKDKSCSQDDDFLQRFLYARKFNVADSFELVISYHAYRQRNSALFDRLTAVDEPVQLALRDGFPGVLPERDRRGRCVLVLFTQNWDHCSYSLITIYRALLLSLEKLLEVPQNQAKGFVVVVDWSEFTFRQSSSLNPKVLKLMIEGLQDCFPARFKGIHFIAQPWYVEAALAVIKPFLKEKTKERMFLHGNNLSTLHDYVAKDILPAELGGEGPSFNPADWAQTLLDSGDIFRPNNAYVVNKNTKNQQNTQNNEDDFIKKPLSRTKDIEVNKNYPDDKSKNQLLGNER